MDKNYNTDCIVVGAGPAGIAAALEVAHKGYEVVLLERAHYAGSKNMYGGAIYTTALKEVLGEDFKNIKYDRIINSHTWSFLSENASFDMTYSNKEDKNAYAIKRFEFESQMIEIAKKEGVYFCPDTLVKNLLIENKKVIGVETELEKYCAPIVIIADGVNSLLAKQIGLRNDFKPKDFILSVKVVLKLSKEEIEKRFNLSSDCASGVNKQYFGTDFGALKGYKNLFMMSYLYTFKDCIALGVGANLEDLKNNKLNIHDVLENIKTHPDISPLIKDGEEIEYSAHLIPEGGYKKMPKLYSDGVMIAGDSAGFINSVHFEGTNFALISGKIAGQSANDALSKKDYSAKSLSIYEKNLKNSFILKDLYSYRNIIENLKNRSNSLEIYYPNKIKEFFEIIVSANCVSKSSQIRKFIFNFIKDRSIIELIKDGCKFLKCALDIYLGK